MEKEVIIKIISIILVAIVFFYFAIVPTQRQMNALRLISATDVKCWLLFGGFLIIYIAYIIAVIKKEEPDKNLNAVWAFFGFASYVGLGILLYDIYNFGSVRGTDNTQEFMITAILCFLTAVILFFDGWVAAGGDICGK